MVYQPSPYTQRCRRYGCLASCAPGTQRLRCQYLYFCTIKASKLGTWNAKRRRPARTAAAKLGNLTSDRHVTPPGTSVFFPPLFSAQRVATALAKSRTTRRARCPRNTACNTCLVPAYVRIRQHTSGYVRIRQDTTTALSSGTQLLSSHLSSQIRS